ncbi:MAG: hypothetical protein ACYDG2_01345 [Ruminiclostridium sp.]
MVKWQEFSFLCGIMEAERWKQRGGFAMNEEFEKLQHGTTWTGKQLMSFQRSGIEILVYDKDNNPDYGFIPRSEDRNYIIVDTTVIDKEIKAIKVKSID